MENNINDPLIVDDELLDFANYFSSEYLNLKPAKYFSKNGVYCIEYLEQIETYIAGERSKTCARFAHQAGIIQMDKSILQSEEYSSDVVFYLILWCSAKIKDYDVIKTDTLVLEYYLTTGRSIKNLLKGLGKLFLDSPSKLNVERMNSILTRLNLK